MREFEEKLNFLVDEKPSVVTKPESAGLPKENIFADYFMMLLLALDSNY